MVTPEHPKEQQQYIRHVVILWPNLVESYCWCKFCTAFCLLVFTCLDCLLNLEIISLLTSFYVYPLDLGTDQCVWFGFGFGDDCVWPWPVVEFRIINIIVIKPPAHKVSVYKDNFYKTFHSVVYFKNAKLANLRSTNGISVEKTNKNKPHLLNVFFNFWSQSSYV